MKQRGFSAVYIIVLIIILILIGVIIYMINHKTVNNPTQHESTVNLSPVSSSLVSGWKTYTSSDLNYQMNYPATWTYYEASQSVIFEKKIYADKVVIFEYPLTRLSGEKVIGTFQWGGVTGIENATLDDFIKNTYDEIQPSTDKLIGDILVKEVHHSACPSNKCSSLFFSHEGVFYQVDSVYDSEIEANLSTLYQMLTTFKTVPHLDPEKLSITRSEQKRISKWLTQNKNLNSYGDPAGTTQIFDPKTGAVINSYEYIVSHHPDNPWDN